MFEKVSRSLKYDSNIFSFTNIYIYMDTTTDHFTPLALHVRGNKCVAKKMEGMYRVNVID